MKTILPALLLLSGCGFGLTPGAVPCGVHQKSGIEVWVDGKGETDVGASYMTCEQAVQTVEAAMAIGDSHDFWLKKDEWGFLNGMRLEFIGGNDNLGPIGEPNKFGYTMNSPFAHDIAVFYGNDGSPDYTTPYVRTPEASAYIWPSAVTLAHEMVHVLQTDSFLNLGVLNTHTDEHCHWASVYAPRYSDLGWAQFSSNFLDKCEHKQCSGASCKDAQ